MAKHTPVRIPVKVKSKRSYGFPGAGPQAYRDAELLVGTGMIALKKPEGGERWFPVADCEYAEPSE